MWAVRAKQRSQQESSRAEQKVPHTRYGFSALHSLPAGEASKGVVGTVTTIGEVYMSFLLQPPSCPAPARALTETHWFGHHK